MRTERTNIRGRLAVLTAGLALALAPVAAAQDADRSAPVDASVRREVAASLAAALKDRYVLPAKGAEAARRITALHAEGRLDGAKTTGELEAELNRLAGPVVDDRHFVVRYVGPEVTARFSEAPPTPEQQAEFHREVALRGHELPKLEWLPGNVGYLRVTMLFGPEAVGAKLDQAIRFLGDTDALIIDVRDTPGGDPEGVANLIGYLVTTRTHVMDVVDHRAPERTRRFHAEPKPGAPGFADKPVFVLTSSDTGSGAEELAYDLQALKRATVVGETTYGAANPGGFRPLAHGFAAFIPTQQAVNPITSTNWEGVGVKPDVAVPADQALAKAHRLAVETLLKDAEGLERDLLAFALRELDGGSSAGGT